MTAYANSWVELCGLVADRLHSDPPAVLDYDLIVVDSAAHQRSCSQLLAARPGGPQITAGLEFVHRPRLTAHIARLLVAADQLPEDGWRGAALQLGLLELLADPSLDAPLTLLHRHIGEPDERPGRAHATARRVARIFRRYASQAPDLVAAWRNGDHVDLNGQPLGARDAWQPVAWRGLIELLGPDPAERFQLILDAARRGPVPGLPDRILLALVDDPPPATADLLAALATNHNVVIHALAGQPGSARLVPTAQQAPMAPRPAPLAPLLSQVQYELRTGGQPQPRRNADASFQIHACHGPNRQVEVLRDVLCGLFTDDPTLQPRDVVVLCPALDEYAPLISASFGLDPATNPDLHPGHLLRAQLAVPTLSALNPVLALLARLFELHHGRATSVDLLDLCQLPPIAARFDITADDLEAIYRLIGGAQIRWGLDANHRQRNQVGLPSSTWFTGVQRMLLSLALDTQPGIDLQTVTPIEAVSGSDAPLIGRLAELVSRVRRICNDFNQPAPAAEWASRLTEAIALLTAVEPTDEWQLSHAHGVLADLAEQGADRQAVLHSGDLAAWLADEQQASGRRPNYGNGSMIFTTLDDMAAIEARVICVLGLDDTRFPGAPGLDGDDLLDRPEAGQQRHWTTDRRARGRQRLRDAISSAQDRFIVITQGADESTGERRPVPLCIAELLDLCAVSGPAGTWRDPGQNALVKWHPLHAHGWADFISAAGLSPSSFDAQALRGARRLTEPTIPTVPPWQLQLAPPEPQPLIQLEDLISFYQNPARAHFRHITGTTLSRFERPLKTELPIKLDHLERWQVGNDLVAQLVDGVPVEQAERNVWLSGQVLPGERGGRVLSEVMNEAVPLANDASQLFDSGPARLLDYEVDLGDCRVQGRISLHSDQLVLHRFGSVKSEQILSAWLQLLLLSATEQHDPARLGAVLVGNYPKLLSAPDGETARAALGELVRMRQSGLGSVLPLPLDCAASYVGWFGTKNAPIERARKSYRYLDNHWRYYFAGFDELLMPEVRAGDPEIDGPAESRFEALTKWLYLPITTQLRAWYPKREAAEC